MSSPSLPFHTDVYIFILFSPHVRKIYAIPNPIFCEIWTPLCIEYGANFETNKSATPLSQIPQFLPTRRPHSSARYKNFKTCLFASDNLMVRRAGFYLCKYSCGSLQENASFIGLNSKFSCFNADWMRLGIGKRVRGLYPEVDGPLLSTKKRKLQKEIWNRILTKYRFWCLPINFVMKINYVISQVWVDLAKVYILDIQNRTFVMHRIWFILTCKQSSTLLLKKWVIVRLFPRLSKYDNFSKPFDWIIRNQFDGNFVLQRSHIWQVSLASK